ncbi:unnamed protein product, partial [Durusdinium trenchii]
RQVRTWRCPRRAVFTAEVGKTGAPTPPLAPAEPEPPRGQDWAAKLQEDPKESRGDQGREIPAVLKDTSETSISAQQLADLEAIASTLGASEAIPQAELLALPEEPEVVLAESEAPMPGLGYISGRARKSFQKTALEVDSFAPSGAQV